MLASLDGRVLIRERRVGTDPNQLVGRLPGSCSTSAVTHLLADLR